MADEVTFSVDYDDMSGMGLWCSAHPHTNLLGDEPYHPYGSEWPLARFNELAEAHRQAVHTATPGQPSNTGPTQERKETP